MLYVYQEFSESLWEMPIMAITMHGSQNLYSKCMYLLISLSINFWGALICLFLCMFRLYASYVSISPCACSPSCHVKFFLTTLWFNDKFSPSTMLNGIAFMTLWVIGIFPGIPQFPSYLLFVYLCMLKWSSPSLNYLDPHCGMDCYQSSMSVSRNVHLP